MDPMQVPLWITLVLTEYRLGHGRNQTIIRDTTCSIPQSLCCIINFCSQDLHVIVMHQQAHDNF